MLVVESAKVFQSRNQILDRLEVPDPQGTPFERKLDPKAEIVDHSTVIGWACFLLRFIPASAGNRTVTSIPEWLKTDHPREVIEAALAHVVRNRVEAAYARSDLFERRRVLMDDWARYLAQGKGKDSKT